jgi:uncharacterized protein (DUF1778 family)
MATSKLKDHRLAVRVSAEQDALIRAAADVRGTTVSDFAISALVSSAHDVLADRRLFLLDDAAWAEFQALLDRPVTHKPKLTKLLNEPSIFDR